MSLGPQYFYDRLVIIPENKWGPKECLTENEYLRLILLFGLQFTSCNEGQTAVFLKYGDSGRQRVLNYLQYMISLNIT